MEKEFRDVEGKGNEQALTSSETMTLLTCHSCLEVKGLQYARTDPTKSLRPVVQEC